MFEKIAPQVARDSHGRIVQFGDRYTVQYIDSEIQVEVEVDDGSVTTIYPSKLIARRGDGVPIKLTASERALLLERIEQGLLCLGVRTQRLG